MGLRHVVRVAAVRPSQHLRDGSRAPTQRVLQRLEHEDAGALAHDEPVASLIPRPRRRRGVVVALRQRLDRAEPAHPRRQHRGVGGPREHQVRLAVSNVIDRVEDAKVAGRARGGDGVVRAHEPQVHRGQRAAHVGDGERNAERVHLLVPDPRRVLSVEFFHAVFSRGCERVQAAHRASDEAPRACFVHHGIHLLALGERNTGGLERFFSGDDLVRDERVDSSRHLFCHELLRVEALYFTRDHGALVCVRCPLGDWGDGGFPREELGVEVVDVVAVRGDDSEAGDDDSLLAVAGH